MPTRRRRVGAVVWASSRNVRLVWRRPAIVFSASRLPRMPLQTSLESPAPVRQIANLIGQWIGRLGAVWVEGQVAQLTRRPGTSTVFLTLRDPAADMSVQVTCPRRVFDVGRPAGDRGCAGRGARPPDLLHPAGHPLARRVRHPAGGPGRAPRPARTPEAAARRRGTVRARAKAPAAVPARQDRPDLRTWFGCRARRPREHPPAVAGGRVPRRERRGTGPTGGRPGDRGTPPARRGPRGRRRGAGAGRRLGRGPACRSPTKA